MVCVYVCVCGCVEIEVCTFSGVCCPQIEFSVCIQKRTFKFEYITNMQTLIRDLKLGTFVSAKQAVV